MAEEDYAAAAAAKREVEALMERLPANKALLAALLERLERRGVPEEEAAALLQQLGELGEWEAAPALAGALHEPEVVAAAAEEALWTLFLRCVAGGVAAGRGAGVQLAAQLAALCTELGACLLRLRRLRRAVTCLALHCWLRRWPACSARCCPPPQVPHARAAADDATGHCAHAAPGAVGPGAGSV